MATQTFDFHAGVGWTIIRMDRRRVIDEANAVFEWLEDPETPGEWCWHHPHSNGLTTNYAFSDVVAAMAFKLRFG